MHRQCVLTRKKVGLQILPVNKVMYDKEGRRHQIQSNSRQQQAPFEREFARLSHTERHEKKSKYSRVCILYVLSILVQQARAAERGLPAACQAGPSPCLPCLFPLSNYAIVAADQREASAGIAGVT